MSENKIGNPVIDIKANEIIQVGFVVRDAIKTARKYSELFGLGPWQFFDVRLPEVILHDQPPKDYKAGLRLAMADLDRIQIELIQPMYGPGTHMEFLTEHGEGIHHLSFGRVEDHDRILAGFQERGTGIEMQGLSEGNPLFTYLATQRTLGTVFEVVRPPDRPSSGETQRPAFKPWGSLEPQGPGVISLEGKKIAQVGLVVNDVEKTAQNYWEMFGLGPWTLIDFKPTDGTLHGISTVEDANVHVKAALTNLGNLQFELLEPVHGPSTYLEFLKTHGEGIHHLSFGQVEDHDQTVSALEGEGIEIEASGVLGGAITFTYMASQKELATIWECVKTKPGVQSSLKPYGTYPPAD